MNGLVYEYATTNDSVRAEELLQSLALYYVLMYESEKERFAAENEINSALIDDASYVGEYYLYLMGIFKGMRERTIAERERLSTLNKAKLAIALYAFVKWNFERIDATESGNAIQTAQLQVAWLAKEQNNAARIYKKWVTSKDSKVCPICKALEGTIIPLDEPFLVNGQIIEEASSAEFIYGYIDRYVAVAHPWCRCSIEFIIEI